MTDERGGASVGRDGEDFVVQVELPGFRADEIEVEVATDHVVVDAERRREQHRSSEESHVYLLLPFSDTVDRDTAQAELRSGVLTIRAPRSADARSRYRRIPVRG